MASEIQEGLSRRRRSSNEALGDTAQWCHDYQRDGSASHSATIESDIYGCLKFQVYFENILSHVIPIPAFVPRDVSIFIPVLRGTITESHAI